MAKHLFVSVGSRFEMNRLLEAVDHVLKRNPDITALAQTLNSSFLSERLKTEESLNAAEFEIAVVNCDVFISHAGIGNLLLATKHKKPIIVMPRRADLGEHINDHQLDTVSALKGRPMIHIANDMAELEQAVLDVFNNIPIDYYQQSLTPKTRQTLVDALKDFINGKT